MSVAAAAAEGLPYRTRRLRLLSATNILLKLHHCGNFSLSASPSIIIITIPLSSPRSLASSPFIYFSSLFDILFSFLLELD
jgi:hypothetical protein